MNHITEDNFNDSFEDIEQLLQPRCEFKASETLKERLLAQARNEVKPRRSAKLWPWLAAACVAGVLMMMLVPPKGAKLESKQLVAVVCPEVKLPQEAPKPTATQEPQKSQIIQKTQKVRKRQRLQKRYSPLPTNTPDTPDEPVQMSEETRMELLLATLTADVPPMEEIEREEEIRQLRRRGERMAKMFHELHNQ